MKNWKFYTVLILTLALGSLCVSCGKKETAEQAKPAQQSSAKKLPTAQDVMNAVMRQDVDQVGEMLAKVPKLANTTTEHGYTLLHIAAWLDNARLFKTIIQAKADPNVKNEWGFTPMHEVVRCDETNDRKEMLEMMIFRKGDVNELTDYGNTPLDIAEIGEKPEFTRVLKYYGAKRAKEALNLPAVPVFARTKEETI